MSTSPQKFMGGRHILLIGDYLQLPPFGGYPCFRPPPCTANRLRHAGYALTCEHERIPYTPKFSTAFTGGVFLMNDFAF
ncbi:hypothetical protein F443_11798 [Phytophthora nicotianae P1569]|uniref:Uncharacterized protein n=1 Tax=Phytophthora nicotianae P1569 TaxID=1317065 RepID=V9EV71_PHYNI|nr:hypothetical protein F443_11798 [Phytophthora nicotianae P1569]